MSSSEACQFCGARLALGAVACFRCGKMVDRGQGDGTTGGGSAPTQLGTEAKGQLLESQWRLLRPIGQGSIGVVWEGRDIGLDRPVAVKLMHEELIFDAVATARFERESRVLATLEHPHIVPILGVGKHGAQPFIVMKLLEGRSLAELIHQRGGQLGPSEAVPVLSQLCEALDFVHGQGVLHRDLKPSNVFVGFEGQVWLLDLGLAREAGSELTQAGEVVGAVPYLSPEQLQGRRDVDRRADVFSLGCLAYEAFTGGPPFAGELRDVLAHQLHTPPPDANAYVPALPPGVGALLCRAMAKIPLERPKTAGDFAAELQRLCGVAADGTSTRGLARAPAMVMPARRPSKEVPTSAPAKPPAPRSSRPDPREAITAPSDPAAPAVPAPLHEEPTAVAGRPLRIEDVSTVPRGQPLTSREGPTGPSARQRARALRNALVTFGVLAVVVAGVIAVSFTAAPAPLPPAPAPIPAEQRPITSVAVVTPATDDVAPAGQLPQLPEAPRPPAITYVDPGKETFKSIDYNHFKTVAPRKVSKVKESRAGSGPSMLEVKVYEVLEAGRKEVKADVNVDGMSKGLSPWAGMVMPGEHEVKVSYEPHPPSSFTIGIPAHSRQTLDVELPPIGAENWAQPAKEPEPKLKRPTPPPR